MATGSRSLSGPPSCYGTQYFRKQFAGITDMAAYEARFNYRYGIVAYMNGVEIFRDHMPEGAVTPGTGSTGAYDAYEYHGVIRPAGEAEGTNNVLAVELHFANAGSENAVSLSLYGRSIAPSIQASENTKCSIYPYGATITATGGNNPAYIFDFTKYNSQGATSTVLLRYCELRAEGAMSSSTAYSNVVSISGATYESSTYQTFYGYFNAKPYQSYRLTVTSPAALRACMLTSIEFNPNSYSVYANYER
ncbi:hypothetical protein WA556_003868 [Blastocystis sp. ATCC 50177/Nand II]